MHSSGVQSGMAKSLNIETNHHSDEALKALNTAIGILNEIAVAHSNTYVTPYSNPTASYSYASTMSNGVNVPETNNVNGSNPPDGELTLDRSQIDNLLKLAAGDSESDEEEEDSAPSETDGSSQKEDQVVNPKPDGDVSATLQRIVNELMADPNGGKAPLDADVESGRSFGASQTNLLGLNTVKEQAAALQRAFVKAGVSINTIIPTAQSQATSQLYAHLSSRANRFPTFGGGINPEHASAYGNTAQMTQRMLAQPGNSFKTLRATTLDTRGNVLTQPLRKWTEEELRRNREYGFPPLPGYRPGQKRKL